MKHFKLIQRAVSYEYAIIEAESREEALKLYKDGMAQIDEWKWEDSGESELIGVDEVGENGASIEPHDIENGEFVD